MISNLISNPLSFIIYIAALLVAITIHEFSHAYMADRLGDPTPKLMGRITFNPLAHLDVLGTLMLVLVGFGWGKPVQFDPFNLRHPKKDSALISLAGPASNLILASILSLILRVASPIGLISPISLIESILEPFIYLNVLLAIFNLIPIHPLDGFKVVGGLLPKHYYDSWVQLERYGLLFLIILLFPIFGTSPIISIISPIVNLILGILIPGGSGGIT
ncbi:site-2 protease family protein [Candidatus Gottesmanbacteria bacterium]|nr:site-2 protease family protein [Candidatus Gottesmanbacteria bacterium]